MFGVYHKRSEYNLPLPPPSGWSGDTLVPPWYLPIPIEHPRSPIFDQASLSKPDSCGLPARQRFSALDGGCWVIRRASRFRKRGRMDMG